MPALPIPRQETFARALARGLSLTLASSEARYRGNWKHAHGRAAMPHVASRVTQWREEPNWDETSDVTGVIDALMRLARKAGDMPTAAAMAAARGLLAEAAKLKGRREDKVETPEFAVPDISAYLPLSDEDWAAKYGPRG